MKKIIFMMFLGVLFCYEVTSQNIVKGVVVDYNSERPIENVQVLLKSTKKATLTTNLGVFVLRTTAIGNAIIVIQKKGYETQNFPVGLNGKTIDLGIILLSKKMSTAQDATAIIITDDELTNESNSADNIAGLLQSSKDIFLRTVAYEFSASFFKIRGLDSKNATVLINGIEMNKAYNNRPQWSNWGGLNDVFRNQDFSANLSPASQTFGGFLGSTNFNIRASEIRAGGSISYASTNRSYTHRMMASYASGFTKNNWSYAVSISRRAADEGFVDGTFYDANAAFLSVEKKINNQHNLNFSAIYTPNKRGKASANTQEVFDLKGVKYNAYWGFQNAEIRNARIKEIVEPLLLLNHYWKLNKKTLLTTTIAYQFGKISNTRIDYNGSKIDGSINGIPTIVSLGGANPDPTYYQKLPSYALKQNDPNVYQIEQEFLQKGQLNWQEIYFSNSNVLNNSNAVYVFYEDRNDDKQISVNSILDFTLNENISLNAAVSYQNLVSENYAKVMDLFGANQLLDVDNFANTNDTKQNDLQQPNRLVYEGEKFKYNYDLTSKKIDGFAQAIFKYNKIDGYFSVKIAATNYQREGFYQNGKFANNNESLGKSKQLSFTNLGVKFGATYKITGRHLVNVNAGYLTKAPTLQNVFSNARISNNIVENSISESLFSLDVSYILRTPIVQAKITGFYLKNADATEVSFYYADGIGGSGSDYTAFVQEILTDIDKKHIGVEFGIEAQITSRIKLKSAVNYGEYTFDNNPMLTLKSETQDFQFDKRPSHLKNYKLPTGPQQAYSIGFEYRDPEYWWFGATMNFFNNVYVDVNPLTRTNNFSNDGGIPFNDYDPEIAAKLLQQEKFKPYNIVNIVGGKSWKINQYYIGVFASVNNLFDTQYKTGGFEQGRNANYRELRDDKALDKPIFGNKYWFGRGTTYFLNINFRF